MRFMSGGVSPVLVATNCFSTGFICKLLTLQLQMQLITTVVIKLYMTCPNSVFTYFLAWPTVFQEQTPVSRRGRI